MINKSTLDFLKQLELNNNKEWFDKNREVYNASKQNVLDVVEYLTLEFSKFDKSISLFDPKKSLFRINRDIRFSKDKSPYKLNFGACIDNLGKNASKLKSCYYLHIQPNKCFFSTGVYMPSKEYIKAIRKAIYYNFEEFDKIINNTNFKEKVGGLVIHDDTLKRVPPPFEKDHPSGQYLKLKHFYAFKNIPDNVITNKNKFPKVVIDLAKTLKPLNDFFNNIEY